MQQPQETNTQTIIKWSEHSVEVKRISSGSQAGLQEIKIANQEKFMFQRTHIELSPSVKVKDSEPPLPVSLFTFLSTSGISPQALKFHLLLKGMNE